MGLDNGIYVKSNKRKITREMLPSGIDYPMEYDYDNNVEIVYWRKNHGLRRSMFETFNWHTDGDQWEFEIDTPEEVMQLIEMIAGWLDEERWENEGDSIWSYENIRHILVQNIVNLALIRAYMESNPDVYLVFYDSY